MSARLRLRSLVMNVAATQRRRRRQQPQTYVDKCKHTQAAADRSLCAPPTPTTLPDAASRSRLPFRGESRRLLVHVHKCAHAARVCAQTTIQYNYQRMHTIIDHHPLLWPYGGSIATTNC